ncbi:MAG TPA: DNRLRE domain-containing protein [Solirubrobacteraceae bacterium]|nr:DNRLRE domain-containing protein [Solirubrobacteraceae bacterium]
MRRLLLVGTVVAMLGLTVATATAAAADPVVMAAGDVACANTGITTPGTCSHPYTSNLMLAQKQSSEGLAAVLALGDLQYESGTLSGFRSYFGPSWGRLASVLRPAPGNHEYQTSGAAGYFDYFGGLGVPTGARGQGWYSFDVGTWHFVSLNSSNACSPVSCAKGSAQETWLRNDLASTSQPCVVAYLHHPLSSAPKLKDMWQDFYDAGVDFVLVGHTHTYKKPFAHNASGSADPNGPRETVVGTGGKSGGIYGVLKLTLHANSADWRFVGSGASDSGSATCHGTPTATKPAASFTATPSGLTVAFKDTSSGGPTSWSWSFGDGSGSTQQNASHTYATAGTYTVSLTATNAAGSSTATQQVTVSAAPPPTGGTTTTFLPVADAYVQDGSPTKNYGSVAWLRLRAATPTYLSYLTFDVSGLAGTVTSAKLRLYTTDASPDGGRVHVVTPGSWSEAGITYATAPALTAPPIAGFGSVLLDAWGQADVTSAVAGNGTVSFGLDSASTNSVYYSSREGANPPQLVVTTG